MDSVLDRNRRLTWGGSDSRPFSRKRNLTSPLLFPGPHRPDTEHRVGLEMLQEEQSGASSEGEASSSSTSSAADMEVRGRDDLRKAPDEPPSPDPLPGRSWSRGGEGVAATRWRSRHHSHGDTQRDHPSSSPKQTQMLDSLHTINSQLGELLNRVGAPTAPRMSMPASFHYGQPPLPEEPALTSSNARY